MEWYEKVVEAHLAVTDAVSHSEYIKSDRFFVWQEDGENSLYAGNVRAARAVTGATELFTKIEFDPWGELFEDAMETAGIPCRRVMIDFEEETGFYHWSWDWEVVAWQN